MQNLTPDGLRLVEDIARNRGFSTDAALCLLYALSAGGGTQAQFNHPELGGMGQWSQGGMIMIGDMFNNGLKYQVSMLCDDLAGLLRNQPVFAPLPSQSQNQGSGVSLFVQSSGFNWWPSDLGSPASSGAQNDMRYAFFPAARRLAIQIVGQTRVYDTGDHAIGGFSQQQGGDQSLTFTSQYGVVRVADLPLVSPQEAALLKQSLMSLRMAFVESVDTPAPPPPAAAAQRTPPAPAGQTLESGQPAAAPAAAPDDEEHRKKFTKKY